MVTLNGKRKIFYGVPSQPASLFVNKREGKLSEIINAGDCIDFTPAVHGIPARAFLGDVEGALECEEITLNGEHCSLETLLKGGDKIVMKLSQAQLDEIEAAEKEEKKEETAERDKKRADEASEEQRDAESMEEAQDAISWKQEELDLGSLHGEQKDLTMETGAKAEAEPDTKGETGTEEENEPVRAYTDTKAETAVSGGEIIFHLNGAPLRLPQKEDGRPYYLMDMIQYSGIDLENPKGRIELTVNGISGLFQQELKAGDNICIQEK